MPNLLLAVFIVCCLFANVPAQRQKSRRAGILIDDNKPAVYFTFLHLKEIKPDDAGDDKNNLFFRITNNTRWNIWLQMSGVHKQEYGDASMYYAIEDKKDGTVRSGSTDCHACSINPLGSGRSILFSVPLREVSRDHRMRITYSFEWELDKYVEAGSYSEHSVTYYFNSLPKTVLPE